MKKIYFITGNKGKLSEIKTKVKDLEIEIIQKDIGYPEIQADSLNDVALFGVEHIRKRCFDPFILEDAGIFIDSLREFPGVYSKYIYYTIGCKGILKLMDGKTKRDATFRSVYAYSEPGKPPILFIGECKGSITTEERGMEGFGYDPIFVSLGETKTFAEMSTEEKNRLSHRGKAIENLLEFLQKK